MRSHIGPVHPPSRTRPPNPNNRREPWPTARGPPPLCPAQRFGHCHRTRACRLPARRHLSELLTASTANAHARVLPARRRLPRRRIASAVAVARAHRAAATPSAVQLARTQQRLATRSQAGSLRATCVEAARSPAMYAQTRTRSPGTHITVANAGLLLVGHRRQDRSNTSAVAASGSAHARPPTWSSLHHRERCCCSRATTSRAGPTLQPWPPHTRSLAARAPPSLGAAHRRSLPCRRTCARWPFAHNRLSARPVACPNSPLAHSRLTSPPRPLACCSRPLGPAERFSLCRLSQGGPSPASPRAAPTRSLPDDDRVHHPSIWLPL